MPRSWSTRLMYDTNIQGDRKRLGSRNGGSFESTHLAKSEILMIQLFTLWTFDWRNKNADNWTSGNIGNEADRRKNVRIKEQKRWVNVGRLTKDANARTSRGRMRRKERYHCTS